ncbi:MAG TPA: hypothetical protein H9903_02730 [Candidatus Aquabacterium excrementipullorum]|nr:hypothetical protein [Candidatus Aquabacterium excrementipullorum]
MGQHTLMHAFFGERSLTKVAGVFPARAQAEQAARRLTQASGFQRQQVELLAPQDGDWTRADVLARKMEPEDRGIWSTVIRAHVLSGVIGFLLGAALCLLMWLAGQPGVRASPGLALLAMVGFGTTFGLLAGGLLSMRPDHGRVIALVRQYLRQGRWAVVAHPDTPEQVARAERTLQDGSERVVRTL